jgi:RNA polymerase sigma factor (sigma-70 family)
LNRIEQLIAGNEVAMKQVYDEHRSSFHAFAARYGLSEHDITDIYQDAFIALIENARKGKLQDMKSSIGTYLFAIGKYMIYRKKKEQTSLAIEEADMPEGLIWEPHTHSVYDERVLAIKEQLSKLGEQCRRLLALFYFEEKRLDDITRIMGYDNKDVAKSQKSRCLKQLRSMVEKNG